MIKFYYLMFIVLTSVNLLASGRPASSTFSISAQNTFRSGGAPKFELESLISSNSKSILKSGASQTLFLTDSTIVFNNYTETDSTHYQKSKYEYNDNNLLISVVNYYSNDDDDWVEYQKSSFEYEANLKLSGYNVFAKDEAQDIWKESAKREYTYNSKEQLISVSEFIDVNDSWKGVWQAEYMYDSFGNCNTATIWVWNDNINDWELNNREEIYHISFGVRSEVISYTRDLINKLWIGSQKIKYSYNSSMHLIAQTDYFWNRSNSSWVESSKREYVAGSGDRKPRWAMFKWNRNLNLWEEWWKIETDFDAEEKIESWSDYFWNSENKNWEEWWHFERSFDDNNNLKNEAAFEWDSENSYWKGHYKLEFEYDDFFNVKQIADYDWDDFYSHWTLNNKRFYYQSVPEFLTLTFIVVDELGNSVPGVQISIDEWLVEAGVFHITGVQKGEKMIVVSAQGYESKSFTLELIDKPLVRNVVLDRTVSIGEMNEAKSLQIFPNPVSNMLFIQSPDYILKVDVFTMNGLLQSSVSVNSTVANVNMSDLPVGMYLVKVETEKGVNISKIIVKR